MAVPGTYSGAGKTGLGTYSLLDDDVASNVAKAADPSSPLIQQARQAGVESANSRGLLNTSIAAGASEGEAYKVALPIGAQNAQQAAVRNASNQNFEQTTEVQGQGNQSQERIAAGSVAADLERTKLNIGSNERIADIDQNGKLALQSLDIDSRERIANMNVAANQQDKAQSAAASYAQTYASMVNAITSNANIPADARSSLMDNAKRMFTSNIGLVESLYNVDLNWDVGSLPTVTGAGSSAPQTPEAAAANYDGLGLGYEGAGDGAGVVAYTDPGGNQYDRFNNYLGTV